MLAADPDRLQNNVCFSLGQAHKRLCRQLDRAALTTADP